MIMKMMNKNRAIVSECLMITCAFVAMLFVGCTDELGVENQTPRRNVPSEYINFASSLDPIVASATTRTEAGLLTIESEDWPIEGKAVTRGTPISSLSGNAGVIGYTKTGETTTQLSTINDKSFTFDSEALSATSDPVAWKSINTTTDQLFVYAYTPYAFIHDNGGAASLDTSGTSPSISYTVPAAVANQKDLIVAKATVTKASSEYDKTVELDFTHALAAIRFKLGQGFTNCYVKSVEIQNVYGAGTYDFSAWTPTGSQTNNYTITVNAGATTNYKEGDYITDEANTLMMIPQIPLNDLVTPGNSTKVVLTYETSSGGSENKTVTATIPASSVWQAGKRITYIINKETPVTTIYFDLAAGDVSILKENVDIGGGKYQIQENYYGNVYKNGSADPVVVTGTHSSTNKYYVYQSTTGAGKGRDIRWAGDPGKSTPTTDGSTLYDLSSLYSQMTVIDEDDGNIVKNWSEYIVGRTKGLATLNKWSASATAAGRESTDYFIKIADITGTSGITVDITIDNIWTTFTSNGTSKSSTGGITIGPGKKEWYGDQSSSSPSTIELGYFLTDGSKRKEKVVLKLKGDNRLYNLMYMGYQYMNDDNSYLKITSSDGDGSPNGSLTAGVISGVSNSAAATIGASDNDTTPPSNNMKFFGGNIFASDCTISSASTGACIGGGSNSDSYIEFHDGCVVTAVMDNGTASAIGGGGGYVGGGNKGKINIKGGKIYAYHHGASYSGYGDMPASAIGGGSTFSSNGGECSFTIDNGEVNAVSIGGAAIGGGCSKTGLGGNASLSISNKAKVIAKSISGTINGTPFSAGNSIGGGSSVTYIGGDASPFEITGGILYAGSIGGGSGGTRIGNANISISNDAIVQGQFIMEAPNSYTKPVFSMTGGTMQPNKSGDNFEYVKPNGGAVWIDGGSFTMSNGTIKDFSVAYNSSTGQGGLGGAVYMASTKRTSTFTMTGGTIRGCSAIGGENSNQNGLGGAVFLDNGEFTMSGGTIGGSAKMTNRATYGGGAIYLDNGSFSMTGGEISYNRSTAGDGGGVYVKGGSFTMDNADASISNNYAFLNGGGVNMMSEILDVSVSIIRGNIHNNTAEKLGGGICVIPNATNEARIDFGTYDNTTFPSISGNNSGVAGGGMYAKGTKAVVNLYSGEIKDNEVSALVPNKDMANEEGSVTLYNTDVTHVTITFDPTSGSISSGSPTQKVVKGTNSLLVVPVATRQNFNFKEWNTAADGSGAKWVNGANTSTLTDDTVLYAIWNAS